MFHILYIHSLALSQPIFLHVHVNCRTGVRDADDHRGKGVGAPDVCIQNVGETSYTAYCRLQAVLPFQTPRAGLAPPEGSNDKSRRQVTEEITCGPFHHCQFTSEPSDTDDIPKHLSAVNLD